ncbi:hypothetical protein KY289_012771 [Solanum tuberosum]|nr:hypothetical protein KY289_012771 [Solanum tuberosum]
MAPRRKNATKHSSPTTSQSEEHRQGGQFYKTLLPSLKREVVVSVAGRNREVNRMMVQEANWIMVLGGSVEFESGSQEDETTSSLAVGPQAEARAQIQANATEEDDEVTPDDTMVQYVHLHEFDPVVRQQMIYFFKSMWTVNRSEEFFEKGIVNKSGGFRKRPLMPDTRVAMADIQFYAIYTATLMNIAVETKNNKASTEDTCSHVGSFEYNHCAGLFKGKHHVVKSESEMDDSSLRERIMRWIAGYIAIEREVVAWVSNPHVPITKASLTFLAKVWWSIVRAQLRPTTNDNTLSPSLASLVACLMVGYLVNAGRIISTEMRDGALNDRAASKIQDVNNPLFRRKSGAVRPLAIVPHTPLVIP